MNYKERLKEMREENELTQEQLAKSINITRGAYKQYELQYDIIPINHLNSICNYFQVSFDYIFNFCNLKNYENNSQEFDSKKFAIRIKELRKNKSVKQDIFAKSINTNQSMISDYENGKKFINTNLLYKICKEYKISADYLLGKTDNPIYID